MSKCYLLLFLLFSLDIYSQEYIDLARFSYSLAPNTSFVNGLSGLPESEFNLQVDLPLVIDEKNAFIVSLGTNLNSVGLHPEQVDNTQLYALNLRLGLNRVYNDTWSGTYLVIPKITTDFSNGLHRGYQLGFVALINQKKSNRLKFTYGLYTNTEEYGQLIVPLLGGYYISRSGDWEITALLPALFDVSYEISPQGRIGLNFDGIGTTYSIDNEFYNDAYVTRGVNQLYSYAQFQVTNSLFLRAKAGYEIRGYRVFDREDKVSVSLASIYIDDNRTQLNNDLKNNILFKLEFIYRFNLPKGKTPVLNEKL